jgi:rubredoxin
LGVIRRLRGGAQGEKKKGEKYLIFHKRWVETLNMGNFRAKAKCKYIYRTEKIQSKQPRNAGTNNLIKNVCCFSSLLPSALADG